MSGSPVMQLTWAFQALKAGPDELLSLFLSTWHPPAWMFVSWLVYVQKMVLHSSKPTLSHFATPLYNLTRIMHALFRA